jgi:adenine-specific DNA-methyltransferase
MDKLFEENIIGVPCMTRKKNNWFSLSNEKNMYVAADILFLYPKEKENLYFILGFLNSIYFANLYNEIGLNKGERIVFTQGFLNEFKIPKIDEKDKTVISNLTKQIIDIKKENFSIENENSKNILKSEIDLILTKY